MRARKIAMLVLLGFLTAIFVGCGGDQSNTETQGDEEKTGGGNTAKEVTTVEGTLGRVDLEKKRITLRPDGSGEPLRLRFNPEAANVTVAGEEATAEALDSRRRAQVQYFERNGQKVARNVNITSDLPQREAQGGGTTG